MSFFRDIFSNFFALVFGLVGVGLLFFAIIVLLFAGSLLWFAVYGVVGLVFVATSHAFAKRGR